MKFGKVFFSVIFGMICLFSNAADIHAQEQKSSPPGQIKILNNYGSIPFNDGETIIWEVRFLGLDSDFEEYDGPAGEPLRESEFTSLKSHKFNPDERFYGSKVSRIVKELRIWVSSKGYPKAEIDAFGEQLPENRMRLIFLVKRGMPVFVSDIRFDGNIIFSNAELVGIMRECLGDKIVFDAEHYEFCAQKKVRSFLLSKGYLKSRIGEITPRLISGSHIVEIPVNEGIRFRYGKIEFEGAKVFSEKELLKIFGKKTGDVADGRHLQRFAYEDLKNAYADLGYVLYDGDFDLVSITPQNEGADGIINVKISIDEGRQFYISKIIFAGVDDIEANQLKENFPLQEGDIFNQSKLEEGIKDINELDKFYPIDKDQDVEIRTGFGESGIDLIIKINKPQ